MRRGVCGMMMSRNTRMSNTQEVGGPRVDSVEKSLQQVGTDSPTARDEKHDPALPCAVACFLRRVLVSHTLSVRVRSDELQSKIELIDQT